MTKAEIVSNVSQKMGIEKADVQATVESFMKEVISSAFVIYFICFLYFSTPANICILLSIFQVKLI